MIITLFYSAIVLITLITLTLVIKTRSEQEKLRRRQKSLEAKQTTILVNEFRQLAAFIELREQIKPVRPLPAFREWAISPDFGLLLCELIDHHKPRIIVEFGGGSSTLICAYRGALVSAPHIYSFDHEPTFAEQTKEQLKKHELTTHADVIFAPLKPSEFFDSNGGRIDWYDEQGLDKLPNGIDLVIVDGPPSDMAPSARYPALPALREKLSSSCVLVLDDAARPSERNIVERWLVEFPEFELASPPAEKGAAVLTRSSGHLAA